MQTEEKILADEEIVSLFWGRKEEAITATEQKYGRYLSTVGRNILHDAGESEECLNDTYLAAWNCIPPNKPKNLQAFLTAIMRNISVDRYRKKIRLKRVPSQLTVSLSELDDCIGTSVEIEETLEARELGGYISQYLKTLSKRDRALFVSRYYCADPVSDLARWFGLSEAGVFKRLAKIRSDLKKYLIKEEVLNE